jgi:hypothetical protein
MEEHYKKYKLEKIKIKNHSKSKKIIKPNNSNNYEIELIK